MKRALLSLALGAACLGFGCVVRTTTTTGGANGGNSAGSGGGTTSGGGGGNPTGVVFGPVNATTLLVDNEWTQDFTSPSYTLFNDLLTAAGINYDTFVSVDDGTPTATSLVPYSTIVWFTGATYGTGVSATVSASQETILENWLDQGDRTLIIFSMNLVYDLSKTGHSWTAPETDTFLANYLGAAGDTADFTCDSCSGGTVDHQTYVVTGQPGSELAGQQYEVTGDTPIYSSADAINPNVGTDILATVPGDPAHAGLDSGLPTIVGRKSVGAKATSQVVYVGVGVENFASLVGYGTPSSLFNGLLTYAGL